MLIYIVHIIVMIVIQMFLMNLLLREDSHVVRLYISYSIDCGGSKVDFLNFGPVNTCLLYTAGFLAYIINGGSTRLWGTIYDICIIAV